MIIALDVGGTRIKGGLVDLSDGTVSGFVAVDTPASFEDALISIKELAAGMRSNVNGAAVCVPGLVDDDGKMVSLPGKLEGAEGQQVAQRISELLSLPVVVVNDAIAYAVGEAAFGAGKSRGRVVVVTIGTGVGVTVIEDGEPIGKGPLGGGIIGGHIPISEKTDGFPDTNGRFDTIEALCCAQRLVDYARLQGSELESVADIYGAYESGNPAAINAVVTYRSHITRAIVALAHAHAPEAVILGGGPMMRKSPVFQGLESAVNERLWGSYKVNVVPSELGDSAALSGLGVIFNKRGAR